MMLKQTSTALFAATRNSFALRDICRSRSTLVLMLLVSLLLSGPWTRLSAASSVLVEDFEQVETPPTVWVVNIPNENASVKLSSERPYQGEHCLKLHYHFLGSGQFQYLGNSRSTTNENLRSRSKNRLATEQTSSAGSEKPLPHPEGMTSYQPRGCPAVSTSMHGAHRTGRNLRN
jgi:hypothetical protein